MQGRAAALRLLDAWHAVRHIGAIDAVIYLAIRDPEISVGPELRQLSKECRRWIKRHGGYRKEDGAIVAKIVRGGLAGRVDPRLIKLRSSSQKIPSGRRCCVVLVGDAHGSRAGLRNRRSFRVLGYLVRVTVRGHALHWAARSGRGSEPA